MAKPEITAASLGIERTERKVRLVHIMPPGGWKTIRIKEKFVSLAAIPALERDLPVIPDVVDTKPPRTKKDVRRGS